VLETDEGSIAVIDFMPPFDAKSGADGYSQVVRIVAGRISAVQARFRVFAPGGPQRFGKERNFGLETSVGICD
jgi:hypothetical protein